LWCRREEDRVARSTKEAWLEGPGDLREEDVEDVPISGMSVRVRGLSAKFSADVNAHVKLVSEGREQVAKLDVATMDQLKFQHGVVEPQFTLSEVAKIQEKFGPAFQKVLAKIDELSGTSEDATAAVETKFPSGGETPERSDVAVEHAAGSNGSDLPVRTGA
jgi:hypothetical protein